MSMLAPIFAGDTAIPRLTVYNEIDGSRMELSGSTLDNWANKIANMLHEEFEVTPADDPDVLIDLPVSWQAAVIIIGSYAAGVVPAFDISGDPDIVFTTAEHAPSYSRCDEVVIVSDDPFGRGIVESGKALPEGSIDFSPTVRFYGDNYDGPGVTPECAEVPQRVLVQGWRSLDDFNNCVMGPLLGGGSVVVVAGMVSTDRLDHIAETEKTTRPCP